MSKDNGLRSNWSKVWGHQLADKDMCDKYRDGWERIWGKKEKEKDSSE